MARPTHPTNPRLLLAVVGPLVMTACVLAPVLAAMRKSAKGALSGANGKIAFEVMRVVGHLFERGH